MEPSPRRRPCARCSPAATCGCGSTTSATSTPGALDRPVRWVHSSDLADPTPFLSEGLVLLTTGTQFRGRRRRPRPVPRLRAAGSAARGVVGLGFGTEVVRDGIPPALADACRDERMPLFEVPYRTPFIAVARANAEAIAAQAYARRSWALAAQRAIALAALRPGRPRRDPRRARPPARHLGRACSMPPASSCASIRSADSTPDAAASLRAEVDAVLRRGARAGSALPHRRHAVHAADPRSRRAPARRHRDGRRRPRPGGSRRRHGGDRDGGARARAAPGARPRARRAARRTRAVPPHRRSRARPADRRAICGDRCRRRPCSSR